jgi:hypothetical protein
MLPRIYPIDYDEAVKYWIHDAEEEAEAEDEAEVLING